MDRCKKFFSDFSIKLKNSGHVECSELSLKTHLYCNPFLILTALIWSSFLRLFPLLYLIHISPNHVVSPDKREKGRTSGLKEKIRGREKEWA